jgi:fluoroquinolone transport system permease protein
MNMSLSRSGRHSPRRLGASLVNDIRLQFRNGFYYVVVVVVVLWAIIFSQLPWIDTAWLLPGLLLGNLVTNTFYFIGGLVLLEKAEGSLEAQVGSPLRTWEYLASKTTSLVLLSLVETLVLVLLVHGSNFNGLLLTLGIAGAGAIYSLVGFTAVARYPSINEFLIPSMGYTFLLELPLLVYFRLFDTWLVYLHPLQAPLVLMESAFRPVETWQNVYGILYSALWIGVFYKFSNRAFFRYIIASEGRR